MENLKELILNEFYKKGFENLDDNNFNMTNNGELILVSISKNIFDLSFSLNYYQKDNKQGIAVSLSILNLHVYLKDNNIATKIIEALKQISLKTGLKKIVIIDNINPNFWELFGFKNSQLIL